MNARFSSRLAIALVILGTRSLTADANEPSEVILRNPLTVNGFVLLPGSGIVSDAKGNVIEAALATPIGNNEANLPPKTRLLFFIGHTFALVPGPATDNKLDSPSTIAILDMSDQPDWPPADNQCSDWVSSWLSPMTYVQNEPPLPSFASFTSIPQSDQPAPGEPPAAKQLMSDFISPIFEFPAGALIQGRSDHTPIAIYVSKKARIGAYAIPARSVIYLYPGIAKVYSHSQEDLADFPVAAGGSFSFSASNEITEFTNAKPISITTGFIVPAQSELHYLRAHLSYVTLSKETHFGQAPISAGTNVCFDYASLANVKISSDATINGIPFAADSNVVFRMDGSLERVMLSKSVAIGQQQWFADPSKHLVLRFDQNNQVRSGTLATPSKIGGINVTGYVRINPDGSLLAGTLAGDQVIAGVPCLDGTEVELNDAGDPAYFTASGDYTIGATSLHRGDHFYGTYEVKGEKIVIPAGKQLDDTMNAIEGDAVSQTEVALRQSSGKFPFGNMGTMSPHDFRWSISANSLSIHEELQVESMFTNPPFADCDANLQLDITIQWVLWSPPYSPTKPGISTWPSRIGGGYSHGVCPGTAVLETTAAIAASVFPHIRDLLDSKASTVMDKVRSKTQMQIKVSDKILEEYEDLLQLENCDAKVVKDSLILTSIISDSTKGLGFAYKYDVNRLWHATPGQTDGAQVPCTTSGT